MKNKQVDIILPNFNKEKYLEETIQSVLNQRLKDWNLIILDNASLDKSKEIINKYKDHDQVKIYLLKKNKGVAFSRNLGLRKSISKYVAFIDSDDLWHPLKLSEQIEFMEKNDYDFSYTNYTPFKMIEKEKKILKEIIPKNSYTIANFIKDTSIATSSMIIKRNLLKCIYFDKKYFNEDYNFKCKILKNGIRANNLPKNFTQYRITKNSRSSYKIKSLISIFLSNKNLLNFNFFKNIKSIFFICIGSIKKYGYK